MSTLVTKLSKWQKCTSLNWLIEISQYYCMSDRLAFTWLFLFKFEEMGKFDESWAGKKIEVVCLVNGEGNAYPDYSNMLE